MLELHEYFRSGSSFRTRIALNLKGLDYHHVSVHLRRHGGEHRSAAYAALNPQQLVPTLVDGDVHVSQSLAIIEYLDETWSEPPLLPAEPAARARVRSMAQFIASEIHPLNNLRVLQYLRNDLQQEEAAVRRWIHTWFKAGFDGLEAQLAADAQVGHFSHGDAPGLADVCLVPQVFSCSRFDFDVSQYPTVWRIYQNCLELDAFERAFPKHQPDAE